MSLEFVSVVRVAPGGDKITEREARRFTCPTCGRLRGEPCFDRHTSMTRARSHTERFARARMRRIEMREQRRRENRRTG